MTPMHIFQNPEGLPEFPMLGICSSCFAEAVLEKKDGLWLCLNPDCRNPSYHAKEEAIAAEFDGMPPYNPDDLLKCEDWAESWEDSIPIEHRKELNQWYYDEARNEREEIGRGLNMALFGKSAASEGTAPLPSCEESEEYMPQWKRWAYFIKAVFCYAFGLIGHQGYNYIEVVTTYYTGSPYDWDARYIVVGEGLFRNWFIDLIHDGESSY